jgi:hypothetical protein
MTKGGKRVTDWRWKEAEARSCPTAECNWVGIDPSIPFGRPHRPVELTDTRASAVPCRLLADGQNVAANARLTFLWPGTVQRRVPFQGSRLAVLVRVTLQFNDCIRSDNRVGDRPHQPPVIAS